MGLGDELMALGQAQHLAKQTGKRVRIVGRTKQPRWHDLWSREAAIVRHGEKVDRALVVDMVNGPGARPYIARWETEDGKARSIFSDWEARPLRASWPLTAEESAAAAEHGRRLGPYAVLEHRLAPQASPNKAWSDEGYAAVARGLRKLGLLPIQLGPEPENLLPDVVHVQTKDFMDVFPALAGAALYIGPECGLHHAAAAVGARAVVIFGHFASRRATGYPPGHKILGGDHGCGRWGTCPDCCRWLRALSPQSVLDAAMAALVREAAWEH